MKYMGSKSRIAKNIIPIIFDNYKRYDSYIEPFVGGANLIDKTKEFDINKIGYDINPYLIKCLRRIRDNPELFPKNKNYFTEDDYMRIKKEYKSGTIKDKALIGYVGFALSYGGKFFGGVRRDKNGKRDYIKEAYQNSIKQSKNIQNIIFKCKSFENIKIKNKSIIYCDPPYKNSTKYKNDLDHEIFYTWLKKQHRLGHKIFVSEYEMPDCFELIWQKEIKSSLTKNTGAKIVIEKLFTL